MLPYALSLFVFCAIASVESASFETDMAYIRMCNRTSPISLRTMNEILINKKLTARAEEAGGFMCFMHCLFTMYRWMDEEGGFNLHFMKAELDAAHVEIDSLELVLYKCTATESVDKCERSFQFLKCFWDTMEQQERQKKEDSLYSMSEAYKRFMGGTGGLFMD